MISELQPRVFLIVIAILLVSVTAQINLALHGTVKQESTFVDGNGTSYSANLAIEGPANNNWDDGCSSTAANKPTQWWGLLLPNLAYISNIKTYYRSGGLKDISHFLDHSSSCLRSRLTTDCTSSSS